MKQSGCTRPLTGFLLLSALCMSWIWLEPEIRYLVWDYTSKTFDVLSRRLFLFADYLCYGLQLAGRSQLNRRLSAPPLVDKRALPDRGTGSVFHAV